MRKNFLLIALFTFFYATGFAQITLVQFSTGFSQPVDIKNCGDSRLFIVERAGYIKITDSVGVHRPGNFLDIHTIVESGYDEQGLLGLAFSPDYQTSGYFYCYYTQKTTGRIHVSRFQVSATNPDSAVASSEQLLLNIYHRYLNHDGGHLAFGPDGYLYVGTGDGGSGNDPGNRSQNLDSLMGKMMRIDVSGGGPTYSIPASNPFVGVNGRDEIWAYGLRNPWRWSFDRLTGDLWIGDVGQDAWEEIDFQPASSRGGENYGWHCYEGLVHTSGVTTCSPPNVVPPVHVVSQSTTTSCAIIGGYVYRGAAYSNMFGKYFFSDECLRSIKYLVPNGSGGFTATDLGSLTTGTTNDAFGEDMWGELYMSDLNGKIFKFHGQSCSPVAFLSNLDTITVCGAVSTTLRTPAGPGFHYSWTWTGGPVTVDTSALEITQGGTYQVTVIDTGACISSSSNVYVQFATMPVVDFTGIDTLYCFPDPPVALTGSPSGGTFSGHGITGNSFSPFAAGVGFHTIYYTYTSDSGCTNTEAKVVHVDNCLGIAGNTSFAELTLYPNPGNGIFTLSCYLADPQLVKMEVLDILGQVIYGEDVHMNSGLNRMNLNLPDIGKGVYVLKISNGISRIATNFVVN